MARIQILELPDDLYDDHSSTPFVLVIDQLTAEQADLLRADTGHIREATGARGVLVFTAPLTIDMPDNHVPVDTGLREQRNEARMWARHGYELGQRSCTWTDHGVAPDWLTEGWPLHFEDAPQERNA